MGIRSQFNISRIITALAVIALTACGGTDDGVPAGEFVAPVVEFQTVFADEFDGDALDESMWNIASGDGCPDLCGWGNNELQIYSPDNITVANGVMSIEGRQEADGSYTSGRINSKGKFDFQYGRIEVSARIPSGKGTWPAIWMLHSDPSIYGPWPLSGEIDIMEAFNYGVDGNNRIASTTHYGLPVPPFNGTTSSTDLAPDADQAFHEYAMEWEKDKIRFYVDGQHFQTQNSDNWFTYYPANEEGFYDPFGPYTLGLEDAPFDQAFHLLLNFAIGGDPVGNPDASTLFPQSLEVDYVRVYECVNANPDTGRGCGTADASVVPLEDLDGGPLANANTAQPFIEALDLYIDGPEVISVTIGEDSASNALGVDGFTGDGATVTNDPAFTDPDDASNTLWHVAVAGGVANVFLSTQDLTEDPILDSGFDFSSSSNGGIPIGEIVFDMQINSMSDGAMLVVKLDSGFPNLGEVTLPARVLAPIGERKTYSVKFADLLANPGFVDCCGGAGVDLSNIVNPFVFEIVGGDADVYLDNIKVTNACYVIGGCKAQPKTKGIQDFSVFIDEVNLSTWDVGIAGADTATGFANYSDGTDPANKSNWAIIDDVDPDRGQVIDVTFNDSTEFGVWFIQSSTGVDMNAFSAGAVVFDIIVDDYGTNTMGMTMKIDCIFPCTSGDKNLGVIADGEWETITVPVATLTGSGLDLNTVNTGLVLFPTDQTGTIRYRLDNIRWVAETEAPPLDQINLPVTFEDEAVDYTVIDFAGTGSVLVTDPEDAINTVMQTTKGPGAETFAGTVIGTDAGFATSIPFTASETIMSVRVYSPAAGIPVMLKVENADGSIFGEVIVNTTVANAWETLQFDYSTIGLDTNATYTKAVIFFDFGQVGVDTTFLWDDVSFGVGSVGGGGNVSTDFESGAAMFSDFAGASTAVVANPDTSGINASAQVGQMQKFAGETFAGSTLDLGGSVNLAAGDSYTMKVRSQRSVVVTFKLETGGQETTAIHSGGGVWEELCFDFSGIATSVTGITVIFDNGTVGDAAGDPNNWTFQFDDIQQSSSACPSGGGNTVFTAITFDDPALTYTLAGFGGAEDSTVVADPVDANNMVARVVKSDTAELWAGTTASTEANNAIPVIPLDADNTQMTVRVYTPDAGVPVRLKIEDASDPTISVETEALTTQVDTWETLTFDFANEAGGTAAFNPASTYSKVSIFFNFGTDGATAGEKIYYFDDIDVVAASGGGMGQASVDFESGATFSDFAGAATAVIANPDINGINTSAQVGQMQKFAGEVFAGSTLDLGGAVDLATGDSYTMKVRASRSVVVTFKLETGGQETTATYSGSGTWEELCFDFSGVESSVTGITVIFDNGTAGDAGGDPANWTFEFDDIQQTSAACATDGGADFETITFDDAAITYTLTDFGGNGSVVQNDPAGGSNMVVQVVKSDTAELWAGTTVSTQANDSVPVIPLDASNTQMTVRVYSPDAGIPVRLKIEDASDATVTVETEAMTTAVNTWETLTFDFANQASGTAAFDASNTYNKVSIFFNFGTDGATAGEKIYYFDDVAVGSGGGMMSNSIALPVTFDDSNVNYELQDFGGLATSLIADPEDANNMVASSNKPLGAELWGGTTVADVSGFESALPFTATDSVMTVRVYSPDTGVPVRLKVEDRTDGTVSVETEAMTTASNTWEMLSFDFANEVVGTAALDLAKTYDKASIFFNFGTDGNTAGDKTYLWDDLTFTPAPATTSIVFDDAANAIWDTGIAGTESPNFPLITDGASGMEVNWSVIDASDAARGKVIEATFAGTNEFGLLFIQSSGPVDMSTYSAGTVNFDLLVSDYGTNTNGMIMKIDCGFPCTSGDQALGVVADGVWETITVPVSQLTTAGLDLTTVNTGIVVFPDVADQQAGAAVTLQIDNVRWEP